MPSSERSRKPLPLKLFAAEFAGTAILVGVGLSIVIVMFSPASPVTRIIASAGVRRFITGLLFGSTGAAIAVSVLGKTSGAHINPVVTLSFWLMGKMRTGVAIGYVISQIAGGLAGGAALLPWGETGRAAGFGATLPGSPYGASAAFAAEAVTTFLMVSILLGFVTRRRLRDLTPAIFPVFYALAVFFEAPISGTSTNPARTLPPEVLTADWQAWWAYWAGPAIGAVAAGLMYRFRVLGRVELEIAKLYHFEHDLGFELSHDRITARRKGKNSSAE